MGELTAVASANLGVRGGLIERLLEELVDARDLVLTNAGPFSSVTTSSRGGGG